MTSNYARSRSHNPDAALNAYHATQVASKVHGTVAVKKLDRLALTYLMIFGLSFVAIVILVLQARGGFVPWIPVIPAVFSGLLYCTRSGEAETLRRGLTPTSSAPK